jgi:hypothetical protein
LEIPTWENSGFDMDGDLIAMCGDKAYNDYRDSKNFVGYQYLPCPVNLEEATTFDQVKDSNGSNQPWDTNTVKVLLKDKRKCKKWFGRCIADEENKRVWASCSHTGTIHGFSTESELNAGSVVVLSFQEREIKHQVKFVNGAFDLVKCGNNVVLHLKP